MRNEIEMGSQSERRYRYSKGHPATRAASFNDRAAKARACVDSKYRGTQYERGRAIGRGEAEMKGTTNHEGRRGMLDEVMARETTMVGT